MAVSNETITGIQERLTRGMTYLQIKRELRVSSSTISAVSTGRSRMPSHNASRTPSRENVPELAPVRVAPYVCRCGFLVDLKPCVVCRARKARGD